MATKKCGACLEDLCLTKYSTGKGNKKQGLCKACDSLRTKLRFFGMTNDEYEELRAKCGDSCQICGVSEAEARNLRTKHYGLYIDHCHESGTIRGLLCHNCNLIIGHAKDDVTRLLSAISYLASTRKEEYA